MTKNIYPLVAGAVPTRILNDFTCNSTTSIEVEDTTYIPVAPNVVTIKDDTDAFVTVEYKSLSGNVLSQLTYISGSDSHLFTVGSYLSRCYTTYDHEALIELTDTKVAAVPGSSLVPDVKVALYDMHITNTNNPHNVSKNQIGLGNVDNTADADKPISTAAQNALDLKADNTDIDILDVKIDGKQNQVIYQETEPTDAKVGDLWCFDDDEYSGEGHWLYTHHVDITLPMHRVLLMITTNSNIAYTSDTLLSYLDSNEFNGNTVNGAFIPVSGCGTTDGSIVIGLSTFDETANLLVSSDSGVSVINGVLPVSVSDKVIVMR